MSIIDKFKLTGKKAYVTGGARGIGKSIATALAEAGADVAIVDLDLNEAKQAASSIKKATGVHTIAVETDVTKADDVNQMIDTIVEQFGTIDIAFNNAGICINVPAEDMTLEQWQKVIDINLTGVFLTSQAVGKVMLKQGSGSIINTASMSAHIVNFPQPQVSYNASKAGVIQLSKSLAIEWAKKGIRVNTISPGYIGTELTLNSPDLKPLIKEWESMSPLGRIGKPEELQAIAVYLAGDASSFTTGSDFVVDGAFTGI
ncbi:SDR family oxidoreductase [Alkalicoccobacillus murimartini]|uniref:NAD(P)-dependent dehydrogenase (Short-subunit alcohol dehydrogenase family) n=1 Tax=Alkalicoccobacillus murimartini TaxID=171685 RepID=A0ABT9YP89_9BACI|nr:SDR family oxidoreductase [Alkalicoccobacillus murimartini]MDQ0209022.1 NAD(P)-dependent dehydrogenase (short-subunit alcohol dehydrogenase family) [Alkalicoccobacillus murimartini]